MLGAGFAGLSVVWHLLKVSFSLARSVCVDNFDILRLAVLLLKLQHSPKGSNLRIDIFDEVGIGGGASGVSGGLLHPYSPKGSLPPPVTYV